MFSKLIKLLFVITAYAPIILICWIVSVYNVLKDGESITFIDLSSFEFADLLERLNLIYLFLLLFLICYYILFLAKSKLTRNNIELKSIKSSDLNMNTLILSYFLPLYPQGFILYFRFHQVKCCGVFGWTDSLPLHHRR